MKEYDHEDPEFYHELSERLSQHGIAIDLNNELFHKADPTNLEGPIAMLGVENAILLPGSQIRKLMMLDSLLGSKEHQNNEQLLAAIQIEIALLYHQAIHTIQAKRGIGYVPIEEIPLDTLPHPADYQRRLISTGWQYYARYHKNIGQVSTEYRGEVVDIPIQRYAELEVQKIHISVLREQTTDTGDLNKYQLNALTPYLFQFAFRELIDNDLNTRLLNLNTSIREHFDLDILKENNLNWPYSESIMLFFAHQMFVEENNDFIQQFIQGLEIMGLYDSEIDYIMEYASTFALARYGYTAHSVICEGEEFVFYLPTGTAPDLNLTVLKDLVQ
jgi:hypothetical protein